MKEPGPIYSKSKEFALSVIKMCRFLQSNGEFIISKQLFRSATSIGANYREGMASESDGDFIHKMSVACKEAYESQYWLELLFEGGYINQEYFNGLNSSASEIIKMLTASILTLKRKNTTQK